MELGQMLGAAAGGTAVLALAGCASPGVPRPPSLHLPAPVRDLSALRQGNSVALHFTAPEETTDHQPLMHKGSPVPLVAALCRVQGASCVGVARLAVAPGQPVDAVDSLPPALTIGAARAVEYRVRVENAAGRDAGFSRNSPAAAGAAPEAVEGLTATTVAEGIQLTWKAAGGEQATVRVEAVSLSPGGGAPPEFGKPAARTSAATARLLQVPAGHGDPGGAIDPAPAAGARVEYRVYRERSVPVDGHTLLLRGNAAEVQAVRSADVFAPAAPKGLLAVSFLSENGGSSVSLSWEPNSEPDVTGYYVYRATTSGAFARVTHTPVAGVSFQDTTGTGLVPGSHVRYVVTAVDRSGNEGARSAVAETDVR